MATELLVKVGLSRLVPLTPHDQELMLGLGMDKDYKAVLTAARPRSVLQNRFYWGLLGKVVENHSFYRRSEALHLWLKMRMGYVEEIQFHDGKMLTKVTSTAFERMPSDEFRTFLDSAIAILCEEVIPGLSRRDLVREVEAMLGMTYDALWDRAQAGRAA